MKATRMADEADEKRGLEQRELALSAGRFQLWTWGQSFDGLRWRVPLAALPLGSLKPRRSQPICHLRSYFGLPSFADNLLSLNAEWNVLGHAPQTQRLIGEQFFQSGVLENEAV
jgi:hypothetical protein